MPRATSDTATVEEDDDELTAEIEAQVNEWSSNSNECFTLELVRSDGSIAASFHPDFTYAMFGEEEALFGYQDLSINLSFRSHDLKPKLGIQYNKLFEAQGDVRPTDIKEALRDFLPESAFVEDEDPPEVGADEYLFSPPGQMIHEYKRGSKVYETWCASLSDPRARTLVENMQILMPMFIEGGSALELEQDWTAQRWKIFLAYEIEQKATSTASPYKLIGYGTSYRIFTFPERQKAIQLDESQPLEHYLPSPTSNSNELANPSDIPSPLDLSSRERLSQFLILPTFHGEGHGFELYTTMYKSLTAPANVREFTVEDPNERFDDLRDFCDLLHLRANVPEFAALRINTDIPAEKMAPRTNIPVDLIVPVDVRRQIMKDTKIMPRQFDRLVEMHTLSFIPPQNRSRNRLTRKEKTSNEADRAYYFWRLYVKQRLYIFNKDQLSQVEHAERIEKLEAALDSVLEAYAEMVDRVEAREKAIAEGRFEDPNVETTSSLSKRKRRVVADDEDNEDEEEEAGADQRKATPGTNGHKKVRVG